ncbi:MAG: Cell division protein SepF [Firmicutes bacterium]|nr:Cell division protein SepF [candidate division NPL-UPA2 bacterium]
MASKNLWKRTLDFFGFDTDEDEELREEQADPYDQAVVPNRRPQQVVDLKQRQQLRVVVAQPRSFDDVPSVVEHIKAKRPLILNLDGCEQKCRQRVLDFMSGATYGSGGRMQKVSEWIFLSAPATVQIDNVTGEVYEGEVPISGKRVVMKKGD